MSSSTGASSSVVTSSAVMTASSISSSSNGNAASTPNAHIKHSSKGAFPTPSFVSPVPGAVTSKEQMRRTLSGGMKKKQKRKLDSELLLAANENKNNSTNSESSGLIKKKHKLSSSSSSSSIGMVRLTPQQQLQQIKLKMKMKATARTGDAPLSTASPGAFLTPKRVAHHEKKAKKPLQDISNSRSSIASETPASAVAASLDNHSKNSASASTSSSTLIPTRKLDFNPTPDKDTSATKKQKNRAEDAAASIGPVTAASDSSSSSSDSSDSSSESGYSSDEAEVSFDAITLGNTRIIREAESPFSSASTASTSSLRPVGLEYRFSVSSTVSSIAVAPNGQFLVVGFYNGTIYLYPLNKDSFRFRGGVLLDHITARGMYTQLMVRVALPEDGKFIFAGVYRGSTEIRAFEVDSIKFPSTTASAIAQATTSKDSDDDDDDDEDEDFGAPHAQAVTHTYSDAKLKGFGAVKSIIRSKTNGSTEYHLLCGLGIKNVHLWRFFQQPVTKEWSWECVFDKQANGISLEFLSFHPTITNQIISKSEHQNIRIWTLEEEFYGESSLTITKKSHVDVKNTVDTTAVFGDYAYGGSEALAMINLRSSSRMELDLPLSTKEQQAQLEAAAASKKSSARITASMRQRNSRRRGGPTGGEELSGGGGGGMRHMRTVSQVAGRETSPFTVGMCSDGSVFFHQPQETLGMATPLEYVEGYERFFTDPSLSFQAQFSDLTRVNTSGVLAVLPLPATEKENWMIVAANQDQLLVRSLKAFLCRNQEIIEHAKVKRGLRNVMRDLGGADSSGSSSSSSGGESESEQEFEAVTETKKLSVKPVKQVEEAIVTSSKTSMASSSSKATSVVKESKERSKSTSVSEKKRAPVDKQSEVKKEKKPSVAVVVSEKAAAAKSSLSVKEWKKANTVDTQEAAADKEAIESVVAAPSLPLVVTTPKRSATGSGAASSTPRMDVASPVVSISSLSSGTSNPNTPEQSKLSQREKQLLVLKDLEWTPPPKAPSTSKDAAVNKDKPSSKPRGTKSLFGNNEEKGKAPASSSKKSTVTAVATKATKHPTLVKKLENGVNADAKETIDVSSKTASLRKKKALTGNNSNGSSADDQVMEEQLKPNDNNDPEDSDVEMEVGEVEDEDDEDDLEALEESEPEFVTTPLVSDGGSLLAASLFQFEMATSAETKASSGTGVDDLTLNEQANLLLHFADQNERLKRNFYVEKERIYQAHDCPCSSSSSSSSRSTPSAASGGGPRANWKKSLSTDFLKRKQLKRRQKKQIALKLKQLHGKYRSQIQELVAVHKLQADALTARQRFNHFYQQLQSVPTPSSSSSKELEPSQEAQPAEPAAPVMTATADEPQPVSISFPYHTLLSSATSFT